MRKLMKAKRPRSRVIEGVVTAVSYPIARAAEVVAGPPVRRSKCPLCRKHEATTEVTIGVVIVRVCDVCSDPVYKGISFLAALTRLL